MQKTAIVSFLKKALVVVGRPALAAIIEEFLKKPGVEPVEFDEPARKALLSSLRALYSVVVTYDISEPEDMKKIRKAQKECVTALDGMGVEIPKVLRPGKQ